MFGIVTEFSVWSNLFRRNIDFLKNRREWMFHVFILGFIFFIILFTAKGRDFSCIKIIYIYPAMLAVIIPLLKGCDYVYKITLKNRLTFILFHSIIFILLGSYLIPIIDLIQKLDY